MITVSYFKGEFSRRFGIAQSDHVLSETIQRCSCSCQPNRSGSRNGESAILLRQILGEKVSIGIENPVYKNAYEILKELDFKIHPISMDESGMCVEQLQKTDANLAYVTPAHQYPTGVIMPIGRRSQLLGWAKKIQIIILSKMIMTASSDIMENQFQRCRD